MKEVNGFGLQRGEKITYRGSVYDADYIARLQLDLYVQSDKLEDVLNASISAGKTGEVGDGKIAVVDVEHVVRIRTGETNEDAI